MLKADLHLHSKEDPEDYSIVKHSAKELIDIASKENFEVLSITLHNKVLYNEEIVKYAEERNILLIPGCERTIEKKHVLLYNFSQEEIERINSFEDLRKMKCSHNLVIAPHPYYPHPRALMTKLKKNLDLFDAIEHSHFYTKYLDFNKRAIRLSKEVSLPLVGNSDTHFLFQFNTTYSFIDSKKDIGSILEAIKKGNLKVQTTPLTLLTFSRMIFNCFSPIKI